MSTSSANSSSLTPLSATALILTASPARLRGLDAGQHLVEVAPAGDGAELLRIERVERDVDAPDAVAGEFGSIFAELAAVGGERQLLERAGCEMARQRGDQRHDAAPHQRLAAGEAQLAHALGDEGGAQAVELLQRQHVGLGQERHVFRHAVDAAEIAAVRDRNAQIGDGAGERIDQRGRRQGRGPVEIGRRRLIDTGHVRTHWRPLVFSGNRLPVQ